MSLKQDLTYTAVIGSKENIIRMLNAAIRNVGTGNEIVDGDDIDEINRKIKEQDGKFNLRIALPDLLEDAVLQEDWAQEKQAEFTSRDTQEECDDEEYYDDEMSTNERMINIEGVYEEGGRYRAEFILYECENYSYYADWLDWGDIARIYDCTVFVDNDLYENDSFYEYCSTRVFRKKNDSVTETRIEPNLNIYEYASCLERLSDMYPARYRERIIRSMEAQIRDLQYEIACERIKIIRETLDENNGCAVIPEGTRKIPTTAFQNCKNLISIVLPEGIEYIDTGAFAGCENLKSIYLPASLKDFRISAFEGCGLETIEVHPDNEEFRSEGNCLLSKDGTRLIIGCKTSVIPPSVNLIGIQSFSDKPGLTDIVIPGSVKRIENYAFYRCPDLRSVIISDGVEEIGHDTFASCTNLTDVSISNSVTGIGCDAFHGCPCLEALKVTHPDIIKDFHQSQDVETEYEEEEDETSNNELIDENGHAVIPDGPEEIEDKAFSNCKGLVSIEIPESIRAIGMSAFKNCSGLTSVKLPSNLKKIYLGAFMGCTGLTSIIIPDGVKEIQECAFKGCTSLAEVTIPEGVDVSFDAFDGCPYQEQFESEYLDKKKDDVKKEDDEDLPF